MGTIAAATAVIDEKRISETVESVQRPLGVGRGRITFDFDHVGEPAIRVAFPVSRKIVLTPSRVSELAQFRRTVRDAVRELGSPSFPYVTLVDAR